MILYIENSKYSTKKLLELIDEFSKVAGYKINIQKSTVFLYDNNELTEREIKKTIPFTIASNRTALAGVAQWIECWPANQRVARLIPSQGTCLG